VATRADGTEFATIRSLDQPQMVEQLTEQGDAGHTGHVVLGRLDDHRRDALPGP
jgi:hypothetical protein